MKLKKRTRSFLFLVGAVLVAAVLLVLSLPQQKMDHIDLSKMIEESKKGQIQKIVVDGNKLTATPKDSSQPLQYTYKDSPNASLTSDYGIDPAKV
jgi:cytochrome c-type biogenesis protein CcmE